MADSGVTMCAVRMAREGCSAAGRSQAWKATRTSCSAGDTKVELAMRAASTPSSPVGFAQIGGSRVGTTLRVITKRPASASIAVS